MEGQVSGRHLTPDSHSDYGDLSSRSSPLVQRDMGAVDPDINTDPRSRQRRLRHFPLSLLALSTSPVPNRAFLDIHHLPRFPSLQFLFFFRNVAR